MEIQNKEKIEIAKKLIKHFRTAKYHSKYPVSAVMLAIILELDDPHVVGSIKVTEAMNFCRDEGLLKFEEVGADGVCKDVDIHESGYEFASPAYYLKKIVYRELYTMSIMLPFWIIAQSILLLIIIFLFPDIKFTLVRGFSHILLAASISTIVDRVVTCTLKYLWK